MPLGRLRMQDAEPPLFRRPGLLLGDVRQRYMLMHPLRLEPIMHRGNRMLRRGVRRGAVPLIDKCGMQIEQGLHGGDVRKRGIVRPVRRGFRLVLIRGGLLLRRVRSGRLFRLQAALPVVLAKLRMLQWRVPWRRMLFPRILRMR